MADKATAREVEPLSVPQEPPENLGTDQLLAGQENNAPPPPAREPVDNLGLDELLGVDGQLAEAEPEPKSKRS